MSVVHLPISRWGAGDGPRVLLVHGLAGNRGTWWNIAEQLADGGCAVVAPDLRGHGDAPTTSRYRFADFATDLAELGDAWDLVIGHSLGGPIACALAQRCPGIAALLLLDPVFEIAASDFDDVAAGQIAEADLHAEPATFATANPKWHPLDAFHKARAARAANPFTIERVMHDNAPWGHATLARGLNRPLRILAGDPSVFTMCPAALGGDLAAAEPLASFATVAGTGHSVHREAPDAVVAAAREMLAR